MLPSLETEYAVPSSELRHTAVTGSLLQARSQHQSEIVCNDAMHGSTVAKL